MSVFFKFLSSKDYDSVSVDGPFISVRALKLKILERRYKAKRSGDAPQGLCMGTDIDMAVIHSGTQEEYLDDATLIPVGTRVFLRRIPGNRRRKPLDTTPIVVKEGNMDTTPIVVKESNLKIQSCVGESQSCVSDLGENTEWSNDFGEDVYAVPEERPIPPKTGSYDEEDKKIKALVNTPALAFTRSVNMDQGFRRARARVYDRDGSLGKKLPPQGYVCHRCNVGGHFIQNCPTNGDPAYDHYKRVRPPTDIPKSMLVPVPDGSLNLPTGTRVILKPSEAAFDIEMGCLPSSSSSSCVSSNNNSIPPELCCPLCKQVMKDAVLTSKCCFQSFCDKCIREHITKSKLQCACGARDILADHLLPNITLRDTIKRIVEYGSVTSNSSSTTGSGVESLESACGLQSRKGSAASSQCGGEKPSSSFACDEIANSELNHANTKKLTSKSTETYVSKVVELDNTIDVKESALQKSASVKVGKGKRKREYSEDDVTKGYITSMATYAYSYNPYWSCLQPPGYLVPNADAIPCMGYGFNPLDASYFSRHTT